MKVLSLILIAIGFVGGAMMSVLTVEGVLWPAYAGVLAVGVIGLVLLRRSDRAAASDDGHVHGSLSTLSTALDHICAQLDELVSRRAEIPPHQFRFEIDRRFRDQLTAFAESREAMQHAFGLQAYADIMSAFAAGERYINRVWTASADGYIDEVLAYLDKAHRQFDEARESFRAQRS
ncbi:MAG: hypothetical protein HND55_04685 [Pseudomonadota bacterium]|nr:MAG: hypothetical protein HND55_04685 [Pseudomonadota bacterium]